MNPIGADIYRYQTVTDYRAVADALGYCWVKGSDGGGPAQVRADRQVNGLHAVGVPVGLYHYAQFTPSPEAQANVLAGEVRRLHATGLPPALDIEAPFGANDGARDFSLRFLRELRTMFPRVAIYGNASMFAAIRPDTMPVDDLVIWVAKYGSNTGVRNPDLSPYKGRADVHQYTSNGRVPGVSGVVDVNYAISNPLMEADMPLTDADAAKVAEAVWNRTLKFQDMPNNPGGQASMHLTNANLHAQRAAVALSGLTNDEANIITTMRDLFSEHQGVTLDITDEQVTALAAAVVAATPQGVTAEVLAAALRRMAEGVAPEPPL